MSKPFTFVIDLDNTSAAYNAGLQRALARRGHPAATMPPPSDYDFTSAGWFTSFEDFWAHHAQAVADGLFLDLEPLPGLDEALNKIADLGVRLVVATYREVAGLEDVCQRDTLAWLDKHVSAPIDEVVFTRDKYTAPGDLYIDDAPYVIESLSARALPYLIMDAPFYNQHLDGMRVHSWHEVPAIVQAHQSAKEEALV